MQQSPRAKQPPNEQNPKPIKPHTQQKPLKLNSPSRARKTKQVPKPRKGYDQKEQYIYYIGFHYDHQSI